MALQHLHDPMASKQACFPHRVVKMGHLKMQHVNFMEYLNKKLGQAQVAKVQHVKH